METVGGEEAAGRFGGSDDRRRGRATVALAKNGKLQQRGRTRTTTAASASTAAAAAAAATADAADNTSEGVARGIEALEAVAAVATSSSSGRSSPGAGKQQAEACGGISLRSHHASGHFVQHQRQQQQLQQQQLQRRHHAQLVEPSEPPVWRRRSEMRGMAALKNVAGSRRASFHSSPAGIITVPGVSQGGYNGLATRFGTATTTTSPIIVPPPPPSPREPRPSPADLSLRISGDSAAGGDLSSSTEASRSVSSLSTEDYRGGGAATAASRGRPGAPTAGGSSTSADSWPVERSGRARVSAEVMRSAAGLGSGNPCRRATHRPAGTATLVGSALATADASGAANGANGSGGGVSSGGVSSGRWGLARKAAGARATVADRSHDQDDDDYDYDYDDYDNASASNSSSTPPAERSPEKRPYSSSTLAPSAEASKKASPRAKGFTAIMFHERFPPAGPVSSGDRRGHANGAWWVEDHFAQPLPSPPPQHQERGQRGRAADNGGYRDDDGHEDYLLGDGKAQDGGGGGGGGGGDRFVRRASASLSMESGVWAENARLRMERQRLADALASIRVSEENAELAEERSRVLAKQAALRVRKADVQRQQAEEAAREAEARAYSLSATVQVLKSAVDCGGSLEGSLTPREIEAEVTAAYQGILQDMDMERATLQEQLISVQSENSMLRAKAMGPRTPRTHSFSGVMTTPSTTPPKTFDISPNARETENPRDLSPLPTPRSFGRPKARGMLSAPAAPAGTARERRCSGGRGGRGEPGEGLANGSRWGSGARGKLGEVLGARVRLVRLEGLGSSRGGTALTGDADGGGGASSSSNNNNPLEAPPPPPKTTARSTPSTPPASSSSSSSPHSNGADPSAKKSSPPSSSLTSSGSRDSGVLGGCGGAPPALPWPREVVLWYGRVSLIVTPGPSGTAAAAAGKVKGVPNVGTATAAVAHWVLLTDAALYVIETCGGGGGGRGESTAAKDAAGTEAAATSPPRTAVPGGTADSLCRLERHRVWSLSLPLETRALPNGDEVAVRSTAVVIRLRLSEEDDEEEEEEEGGDAAGGGWWKGVAAVER
ncbi:unnamed protein product [Scytosiphon promiscuus]